MKTRNLLFVLAIMIMITAGALVYLTSWLYQAGGPFSIDPEGCGVKYVSYPGDIDKPVRICREGNAFDMVFVPISKFIVVGGPIVCFVIVLLLLSRFVKTRTKNKIISKQP